MLAIPTTAIPNRTSHIAIASFIGTAIEFYDFYVYAIAAALVIGPVFFPSSSPTAQTLNAFATFGIAFLARPVGSFLFGHFGDRFGRKSALVATLLTMGVCTTLIGLLPGHARIGDLAPWLLVILRIGQGLGLGGEWGGAALLATENAPWHRRGLFGMFPQLGPSIGFLVANGLFLLLGLLLTHEQFMAWGWRIPFLVSAVLVLIGLYARLKLTETPLFKAVESHVRRVPLTELIGSHLKPLILGSLSIVVCYALFYISAVFVLSYGIGTLHLPKPTLQAWLMLAIVCMALATVLAAWASDILGRRAVLVASAVAAVIWGFALAPLLGSATTTGVGIFLCGALFLMGMTYAPLGAMLPEIFPTTVRYTGSGAAYNLGGILGASLAPYVAQVLVTHGGLSWVGGYISVAALISLLAVWGLSETRHRDLAQITTASHS
ncbi:MAG: MFS transporter [Pseudomonadota bacterium]